MQDFATLDKFTMPSLQATGGTPMGEAIETALKNIDDRLNAYKSAGITAYAPWVYMITDGQATDDLTNAITAIQRSEKIRKVMFYAIGVDDADMSQLASLSKIPAMKLNGLAFKELALFISTTIVSVTNSKRDDVIDIPNPETTGLGQIVVE